MRRALCHVLAVLSVLAVGAAAACTPAERAVVMATIERNAAAERQQAVTTTEPVACCTPEQAAWIEGELRRQEHDRFVAHITELFARHPLRPIAGCESSYPHTRQGEPVWTRYNEQGPGGTPLSTASGGLQILDGTWRDWTRGTEYAGRWARAAHAPAYVQMDAHHRHQPVALQPLLLGLTPTPRAST